VILTLLSIGLSISTKIRGGDSTLPPDNRAKRVPFFSTMNRYMINREMEENDALEPGVAQIR
jgi:hypothetical protein